jgi:hypothetical protein
MQIFPTYATQVCKFHACGHAARRDGPCAQAHRTTLGTQPCTQNSASVYHITPNASCRHAACSGVVQAASAGASGWVENKCPTNKSQRALHAWSHAVESWSVHRHQLLSVQHWCSSRKGKPRVKLFMHVFAHQAALHSLEQVAFEPSSYGHPWHPHSLTMDSCIFLEMSRVSEV